MRDVDDEARVRVDALRNLAAGRVSFSFFVLVGDDDLV